MKRLIAMTMALATLMSTSAFAAGTGAGDHATDVTATFVDGNDASPIVYSVDITWDELGFTYYEASSATWDPVNHKYNSDSRAAGWDANDKASVEIVNHSNTDILATFSYEANAGYESAGMDFDVNELYVASAEDGSQKTGSNTVTPTGSLPEGTKDVVIGSITINIAQCPDVTVDDNNGMVTSLRGVWTAITESRYTIVEDASAVESGEQYILKSDYDAMNSVVQYACSMPVELYMGNVTQEEANEIFYSAKADVANFIETKIYTKP